MDYKLGGTISGSRTVEPCGNLIFEDLSENRRGVIIMGTYKKEGFWTVVESGAKDEIEGVIYKVNEEINDELSLKKYFKKNPTEITNLN